MVALLWDQVGARVFETGVDRGVLYHPNNLGDYEIGYAWNGLTGVTESPSGAEESPQYADNIQYLSLRSAEKFGGTITAFTYPKEFGLSDGTASPQPGVTVGQQGRKTFGLSYRTRVGNDLAGTDYGYKIHLVWGATASPSERAYGTINESPEATELSWEFTTLPVGVPGFKPTATITIDSTLVDEDALEALENLLYGTAGTDPQLPSPAYILDMFDGTITTTAQPTAPSYNASTDTITIPSVTGIDYMINDEVVTGAVVITVDTIVTARPKPGYTFPALAVDRWKVVFS